MVWLQKLACIAPLRDEMCIFHRWENRCTKKWRGEIFEVEMWLHRVLQRERKRIQQSRQSSGVLSTVPFSLSPSWTPPCRIAFRCVPWKGKAVDLHWWWSLVVSCSTLGSVSPQCVRELPSPSIGPDRRPDIVIIGIRLSPACARARVKCRVVLRVQYHVGSMFSVILCLEYHVRSIFNVILC